MATEASDDRSLVTIQELIRLPDIGVSKKLCTWSRVSLNSDTHICIRNKQGVTDNTPEQDEVLVLKLKEPEEAEQKACMTVPFKADSAAISPCPYSTHIDSVAVSPPTGDKTQDYLLAYQDGSELKVIALNEELEEMASCHVTGIRYWTWLTSKLIAIVTRSHVLHWTITDQSDPVYVFEVDEDLMDAELTCYRTDAGLNWLALTGLTLESETVVGITQLYCKDKDVSQMIMAHTTLFTSLQLDANGAPCPVLCTACRDTEINKMGKVHVIPLGTESNQSASTCLISFQEDAVKYDFPVVLQAVPSTGLLYMVSKYGQLYLCDMITAECLCFTQISKDVIFAATINTATNGLLLINRQGQVLQTELKTEAISRRLKQAHKESDVVRRLSMLLPSP